MNYLRKYSFLNIFKIEKNKNEFSSIEVLRGLAALSVCLFHFSNSTLPTIKPNLLSGFFSYGYLGVQVFFVISGYIIPFSLYTKKYELKNFGSFIIKRMVRLAPPAYVCIILMFVLYYSAIFIKGKPIDQMYWPGNDLKTLFHNLTFSVSTFNSGWYIDVFWTLEAEIYFYIFIGIVFPLIMNFNKKVNRIVFIAIIGIVFSTMSSISFFHFIPFLKYFVFFYLGLMLFLFQKKIINIGFFQFIVPLTLIICYGLSDLVSSLVAFITLLLINQKKIGLASLTFLGTISYSLYITHHFSGIVLEIGLKRLFGEHLNETAKVLMLFLYTTLSVLFATLFYKFIESPFLLISKKIK